MKDLSTEKKILDAAKAEFAIHGFGGSRIDSIARKGKINKAMIYYYFRGKEKLYEQVLSNMINGIYSTVNNLITTAGTETAPDQLELIISGYARHINTIDDDYIRIMIREVASGGKYFKKIAVPGLIEPVIEVVTAIVTKGQKEGLLAKVNPKFVMIQVIGSILFFNILRITLKDTPLFKKIYTGDFSTEYINNLTDILRSGILLKKGK